MVIATKWGPMFEGGQMVTTVTPEYARNVCRHGCTAAPRQLGECMWCPALTMPKNAPTGACIGARYSLPGTPRALPAMAG